ncbi:acyl-ACP desaturase [Streptomyces zhihengii]
MTRLKRDDASLIAELEPVAAGLLDRHIAAAREWFPHQYVPWSTGRDFDGPLGGEPWQEDQSRLDPAARSALIVNLLTEDNLPGYHHALAMNSTREGAWGGSTGGPPRRTGMPPPSAATSTRHVRWIPSPWSGPGWPRSAPASNPPPADA